MSLKQFDLISDVHLDFHLGGYYSQKQIRDKIDFLIESLIPEFDRSTVLVIAGDLGHHNDQNIAFLTSMKRFYEHILIVFGNHDLYMCTQEERERYSFNSLNRWQEIVSMASEIPGVMILDGTKVTIDGTTFTGAGMWYDSAFGLSLGYSKEALHELWKQSMNDAYHIFNLPSFEEEHEKLTRFFDEADVIVTHVGPDWSRVPIAFATSPITSFFYFDGLDFLARAAGKTWCFGHTHEHASYDRLGCYLVNNALGYPSESYGRYIRTVSIEQSK